MATRSHLVPLVKLPPLGARGPRETMIAPALALPDLGPHSSIPARILVKAIAEMGIPYRAEVPVFGGRSRLGGAVLDIYLPTIGGARNGTVVRVQGEYFHEQAGALQRDMSQLLALKAAHYRVVDIWVHDIETRLDWVLQQIGIPNANVR